MTPREYIDLICRPHVEAFAGDPTCLHKAWAAVIALWHFADHLAKGDPQKLKKARDQIRSGFPRFDLTGDIANASKHFKLTRSKAGRDGFSIDDFSVGKSAAYSDGTFHSDGTSYSDHSDVVRADFADDYTDVLHLCKACLAHIETIA